MALDYLSDDEISGKRERQARRAARKARRERRKRERRARKETPKGKQRRRRRREERRERKKDFRKAAGKKESRAAKRRREGRPSRIARIGLAPARGAFHTAVRLNLGKTATKMVRVYEKKGGKKKLMEFWRKFGGKWKSLRKSINKGAKASISADELGQAGVGVAAIAAPIIIAITALIKEFKAGGSAEEQEELQDVIDMGLDALANDPKYEDMKGTAYMNDENVAVLSSEDDEDYDDDDIPTRGMSFYSLSGLLLKSILMLGMIPPSSVWQYVIALPLLYMVIAFLLLPFQMLGKIWVYPIYQPINWLMYGFTKLLKRHG